MANEGTDRPGTPDESSANQSSPVDVSDIVGSDDSLERKAELIIERYAFSAGVLACQPFPIADFFILTPLEAGMALHLASLRGFKLVSPERDLREIAQEVGWGYGLASLAKYLVIGLYKFVPYVGIASTVPTVFAVVYAMGHVQDSYITAKVRGDAVTPEVMKAIFDRKLRAGKDLGRARLTAIRQAWRSRR